GALSSPERKQVRSPGLLSWNRQVPDERTLQWIRQDLHVLAVQFVEQAIPDPASKSSSEPAGKSCLLSLATEDRLPMKRARSRLLACEKGRPHLHAFGSKSECCQDSARVSNSACGPNRELHGIHYLRHQRHRSCQRIFGRLQKGA